MELLKKLGILLPSLIIEKKENVIPVPVTAQKEECTKKDCG
ncbi:hypothetical protein VFC49_02090 [Thermococcus sp. SY098]|nr:hypothetical protein [Thermococcus sp. SY098]WRS52968.1 hypothetical protein VFC49_02090 [Thermococcus sp. SY098]